MPGTSPQDRIHTERLLGDLLGVPPRGLRATLALTVLLAAAALAWALLTHVDLVVRATGRVRPAATPEWLSTPEFESRPWRVREVLYDVGDTVRAGDVLVRLDTSWLDTEIDRLEEQSRTLEQELASIRRLGLLAAGRHDAERERALSQLEEARRDLDTRRAHRDAAVRVAETDLETARAEETRARALGAQGLASQAERERSAARLARALEELRQASLPVNGETIKVFERELALIETRREVDLEERRLLEKTKRGELDAARLVLARRREERRRAAISAPRDGVVTAGELHAGDVLQPASPVISLAPAGGYRVDVAVDSRDVASLRLDLPARIRFEAPEGEDERIFEGRVAFISPDSHIDDEGRVAYAVRIEIVAPEGEAARSLRGARSTGGIQLGIQLGMRARAEVRTGRERLAALLLDGSLGAVGW